MRRFYGLLLCIGIVLSAVASWASETTDFPLGSIDYSGNSVNLAVSKASPEYTSISLNSPNVVIQDKVVDYQTYQAIGIPGEPFLTDEGAPTVPMVSRMYRIPNTGGVELKITNATFEIMDNINSMPLQIEGSGFVGLKRQEAVYSRDEWFPKEVATISEPMILRDFRVVVVTFYPVQVNPVTHQARVYNQLSADVVATSGPGINELTNPRRPSGAYKQLYRNLITNLDESALDNATDLPGSYLIICKTDTGMARWSDSLRIWKKRSGFNVVVDARANWTAATMRTAIQNAYANWNPPLEFVCLMGDPQASIGLPTDGGNFDHTFALGNTGDDLEDIGVGRLSGNSWTQMATINNKIMSYERNPWMQTAGGQADTMWFHKSFLYAGIGNSIYSNYTLMLWASHQLSHFTEIDSNEVQSVNGAVNTTLIANKFASGIGLFLWRGSWLGQMDNTLANTCNSGWRLPLCLTVTCGAGNFDSDLGTSESYLVAGTPTQPRGGICGIGSATSGTHAPPNICFTGGLVYSLVNANMQYLGQCMNAGKAWLFTTFAVGSGTWTDWPTNFSRYNNLMGEPTISMWTKVPVIMNVTHPMTVNVGTRRVHVLVTRASDGVPIPEALVVLWKGTETFTQGLTDANGAIDVPATVDSPGDLLVTVTKRDHYPYLATVACANATQMTTLTSYTLDDDNAGGSQGNGNGIMNPGELIDLPIFLKNFGTTDPSTNVSATLSSMSAKVTVVNATSTYPSIAPGDSVVGTSRFRINVSQSMQDGETALMSLAVTTADGQTFSSFTLTCHAGHLVCTAETPSGVFDPGTTRNLTVTLRNSGTLDMPGVTATLVSMSPFVSVDDAAGTFGAINVGLTAINTADQFTVRSHELTHRGHQAPMLLIATTTSGFVDSLQFTLSVGTATAHDPTGPDAYGYYAYDNTDSSSSLAPTFAYVNISATGTNLSLNDPGDQQSITPMYSTARALPFPFKFYGVTYDTITICSNGWAAFGNQSYFGGWRNYQIPSMQAPDAVLMPYFDDLGTTGTGKGVWIQSDATNHTFIIQWKAFGANSAGTSLDFEVVLYDTTFYPTRDGNGKVVFQYQTVTMNLQGSNNDIGGCSIGIQNTGGLVGLEYAYVSNYMPGASTIQSGRAILFTTSAFEMFGAIKGTITDAETSLPMTNAHVTIDGHTYLGTTNAQGSYLIPNVLIGTYALHATYPRYNSGAVTGVLVELNDTTTVNFSLQHPEIDLSVDSLHITTPTQPTQTTFDISNAGNGPLDYNISIAYAHSTSLDDSWDRLATVNVSQLTNDYLIQGCEFALDNWWVTGGGGPEGNNLIYKFDRNGALAGSIAQPGNSQFGWFDMAFDGTNLYGSDNHSLTGINPLTGQVAVTIPSPLQPSRAVAYDPATDHFYVADYTSDIYEISRQGVVVQQIANSGTTALAITGMAWNAQDEDGYKLYIFSQNGSNPYTKISKMHTVSHSILALSNLDGATDDRAGGCTITRDWNSTLMVMGGILQNTAGDKLAIYEMSFNTSWITVNPSQSTVPGAGSSTVTVSFHTENLRPNVTYRVNLFIHSNVLDSTLTMPVALTYNVPVTDVPTSEVPTEYKLRQNYPNPFNPNTTIRYDLKAAGHTKLTVYNVVGQEITTLVDEMQSAGVYNVTFDGGNLSSGVYFYRLESGSYTSISKMVLMK